MLFKKYFFLTILLGLSVYDSVTFAQNRICGTVDTAADFLSQLGPQRAAPLPNATVQIFIHIIRKDNGNGGASLSEVLNAYNNAVPVFQVHGICLNLIGTDFIDNNDFAKRYEKDDCLTCTFEELIQVNSHLNAIDIYIVPKYHGSVPISNQLPGLASGIPGKALVLVKYIEDVNGDLIPVGLSHGAIMAHEIGHCLGLSHTHHGTDLNEGGGCQELVIRSINTSLPFPNPNCKVCGDFICETPADPGLLDLVDASCNYTGTATDANGQVYTPNTNNIMSYTRLEGGCGTHIVGEQGLRILEIIANSPLLMACLAPANIVLQNFTLPYNQPIPSSPPFIIVTDQTFTAQNTLTAGPNVTVNPTGELNLVAESKVILLPGFKAQLGSHFCAQIGLHCNPIPNCRIIPTEPHQNNYSNNPLVTDSFLFPDENEMIPLIVPSNKVSPNPSNGKFTLEITNFAEIKQRMIIEILNTLGEIVLQSMITNPQCAIDLSTQSKGVYFIKVQSGAQIYTEKIIIQ